MLESCVISDKLLTNLGSGSCLCEAAVLSTNGDCGCKKAQTGALVISSLNS